MKKLIMSCAVIAAVSITTQSFAQFQDEKNVTITMDLQPILQLNMSGPDNLDFTFSTIPQYTGGIVKYGATQLTVSATVDWDLYAVGTSSNGIFWDSLVSYGGGNTNSTATLPLSILEMHQYPANPSTAGFTGAAGRDADYSHIFDLDTTNGSNLPGSGTHGHNSIYASNTPYTEPASTEKYIAGHAGALSFVTGGSYLTQTGTTSNYKYIIDYRILPGLPVVFPMAGLNDGTSQELDAATPGKYAQPGIYSMNVKYVLAENQ